MHMSKSKFIKSSRLILLFCARMQHNARTRICSAGCVLGRQNNICVERNKSLNECHIFAMAHVGWHPLFWPLLQKKLGRAQICNVNVGLECYRQSDSYSRTSEAFCSRWFAIFSRSLLDMARQSGFFLFAANDLIHTLTALIKEIVHRLLHAYGVNRRRVNAKDKNRL